MWRWRRKNDQLQTVRREPATWAENKKPMPFNGLVCPFGGIGVLGKVVSVLYCLPFLPAGILQPSVAMCIWAEGFAHLSIAVDNSMGRVPEPNVG